MSDLSNSAPSTTPEILQNQRPVMTPNPAEIPKTFPNSTAHPAPIPKPRTPEFLHQEFVRLGKERRNLTYKLLALLPEIYKQEIFKKHGYATIYEYAGRLGGLSDYVVDKTLRLQRHLENKPFLRDAVETVGVHKVDMIARLATPETDRAWADKVENMSKASLQELSKEARSKGFANGVGGGENLFSRELSGGSFGEFSGGQQDHSTDLSFCQAAEQKLSIELDPEMQFMFLKIKQKVGKNLSNREVLREILKAFENLEKESDGKNSQIKTFVDKIHGEKVLPGEKKENESGIGQDGPKKAQTSEESAKPKFTTSPKISRYIPVQQKRLTLSQTNNHCAYPNCPRPPEIFHHVKRFALGKNHDSVIPLCKIHHEFAHNGVIEEEEKPANSWRFKISNLDPQESETARIDSLYRKFRRF